MFAVHFLPNITTISARRWTRYCHSGICVRSFAFYFEGSTANSLNTHSGWSIVGTLIQSCETSIRLKTKTQTHTRSSKLWALSKICVADDLMHALTFRPRGHVTLLRVDEFWGKERGHGGGLISYLCQPPLSEDLHPQDCLVLPVCLWSTST